MNPSKNRSDALERRFLNRFEPQRRSHVANSFLDPVRQGMTNATLIMSSVRNHLMSSAKKCERSGDYDRVHRNRSIIDAIDTHPDEAIDYARWALSWERLPAQEKRRHKAERWMAEQPPTGKQVAYLRALGYTGEVHSKQHASELIDKLKKQRKDFV